MIDTLSVGDMELRASLTTENILITPTMTLSCQLNHWELVHWDFLNSLLSRKLRTRVSLKSTVGNHRYREKSVQFNTGLRLAYRSQT